MRPAFRRTDGGRLILGDTPAAEELKRAQHPPREPETAENVHAAAERAVRRRGGDPSNEADLLGEYTIQFGKFRGKTFRWILENALGYAGYLVAGMDQDKPSTDSRWHNKEAFKRYVELFPEGREAVQVKRRPDPGARAAQLSSLLLSRKELSPGKLQHDVEKIFSSQRKFVQPNFRQHHASSPTAAPHQTSPAELPLLLESAEIEELGASLSDEELMSAVTQIEASESLAPPPSGRKRPSVTPASSTAFPLPSSNEGLAPPPSGRKRPSVTSASSTAFPLPSSSEGLAPPPSGRKRLSVTPASSTALPLPSSSGSNTLSLAPPPSGRKHLSVTPASSTALPLPSSSGGLKVCLPGCWEETLPKEDQAWISKALFRENEKGFASLQLSAVHGLWFYPPQPPLCSNNLPVRSRYFASPLFLWMPRQMWRVVLRCPHPGCNGEMTSAGLHKRTRRVLDVNGWYNIASEYLACSSCKKRLIAWHPGILSQLDVGHRSLFPCILTRKLACDLKVVLLLRNRGLGNSSSQVYCKLVEQHEEGWLRRTAHYLTDCDGFTQFISLLPHVEFTDPPSRFPVPKYRWLMQVYCLDVLERLEDVKASITSVTGRVLKMDSTKKVVKKLAGAARGTAAWATNVGNEYGQVLVSVLTAKEGHGLGSMLQGLVARYRAAGMAPPQAFYVDRDCCGPSSLRNTLRAWPELSLRLDIWHFMRRLSTGCTTDSHQLYASFMANLTRCIFEWDPSDVDKLLEAKRSQMRASSVPLHSDSDVMKFITSSELALHCRRSTRGEAETRNLITKLIASYSGERGRDTLGVPLIHDERMGEIWQKQQKHVKCIQDPVGLTLYTQTGSIKKGDVVLPVYRCARGTTSLESFHLHLNRFIPGTMARDSMYQAYLLEGLARWNQDRANSARGGAAPSIQSYSGLLKHSTNILAQRVLRRTLDPSFIGPRKYTGELLGVDYLYSQTGIPLLNTQEEIAAMQDEDVEDAADEEEGDAAEADEGFAEEEDPTITTLLPADLLHGPPDSLLHIKEVHQSSPLIATPTALPVPATLPATPTPPPVPVIPPPATPTPLPVPVTLPATPPPLPVPVTLPATPSPLPVHATMPATSTPPPVPITLPATATPPPVPVTLPGTPPPLPVPVTLPGTPPPLPVRATMPATSTPPPVPVTLPATSTPPPVPVTLPATSTPLPVPVTAPSRPPPESSSQDSVGPDNIPGYDRVQALALFLVSLRNQDTESLSGEQATQLIGLWDALSDYDKRPTIFQPRHRPSLVQGRFRATKTKSGVTPGVESSVRCVLGPNPGAAQWPDCNRYTEATILRLSAVLPSWSKDPESNRKLRRWDLVNKTYNHIRNCVINNAQVMRRTRLQLPLFNATTLQQWYNRRGKEDDRKMLCQGVTFTPPPVTASQPCPGAQQLPETLPVGTASPHQFSNPPNTAGTAKLKGKKRPHSPSSSVVSASLEGSQRRPSQAKQPRKAGVHSRPSATVSSSEAGLQPVETEPVLKPVIQPAGTVPRAVQPAPAQYSASQPSLLPKASRIVLIVPPQPSFSSGSTSISPPPSLPSSLQSSVPPSLPSLATSTMLPSSATFNAVPYTTQYYRRKKQEAEQQGIFKRKYTKTTTTKTCKKCGQILAKPTHEIYYGKYYCSLTADESLEAWRARMRAKKQGHEKE